MNLTHYQSGLIREHWYPRSNQDTVSLELTKSSKIRPGISNKAAGADLDITLRRPLWELFYPMVKFCPNPLQAAKIIACYLRSLDSIVEIRPGNGNLFHEPGAILLANSSLFALSMRALGVPARENAAGGLEILTDSGWTDGPALSAVKFNEL